MIGTWPDGTTSYPADVLRTGLDYHPPTDTAGLAVLCCDCLTEPAGAGWPASWQVPESVSDVRCLACQWSWEQRQLWIGEQWDGEAQGRVVAGLPLRRAPVEALKYPDPAPDSDELRRQRDSLGRLPEKVTEAWAGPGELDSMRRGFGDEVHLDPDHVRPASGKRNTDSSGEYTSGDFTGGDRSVSLDAPPVRIASTFGETNYVPPPPLADRCVVIDCYGEATRWRRVAGERLHLCERHDRYARRNRGRLQGERLNARQRARTGTDYLNG